MRKLSVLTAFLLLAAVSSTSSEPVCGDMDFSGSIDIADLVYLVDYMFAGGPPPPFPATADCNGDGQIDISDLVCWVDCWFVFEGGCTPQCAFEELNNHTENSGGCLRPDGAADAERGMYIEAIGNEIHVYHPGAYYQCCLGYYVEYYQTGNQIFGFETDTNEFCDCYCFFDLESVIHNLAPGEYIVTLFGIEGDLVGVDTAVIETGIINVSIGDCQMKDWPEEGDPIVNYSWSAGVLTLHHPNAYFNCGAMLVVAFEWFGDTLRFREKNLNDMVPVPCMCYYDMTVITVGIPPGTYIAEIYNQDYPWLEEFLLDRQVITLR